MLSNELFLLVSCCIITLTLGIRVDFNTNTGPIVPPTPRPTITPQLPYREPAPVWEDQSDDIPNPNSYVYILPPPSRPRYNTNNYLTFDRRPVTQVNNNYGQIVPPQSSPNQAKTYSDNGNTNIVASLSPKYIPNVGIKYYAVVPSKTGITANNYYGNDKVQGKYNPKTKKYKVSEKVKYNKHNQYPFTQFELPYEQRSVEFNQQEYLQTQALPFLQKPQPFQRK